MLSGSVQWDGEMVMVGETGSGHRVMMDAGPDERGSGASPKELTLLSLGGCTGVDVVSILQKMQVPFQSIRVDLEADSTDENPKVFREIRMIYKVEGEGVRREQVERAIQLSQDRYCGVSAMLNKTAHIVVACEINGERKPL